KEDDYRIEFAFHGELVVPYLLPVSYVRKGSLLPINFPRPSIPHTHKGSYGRSDEQSLTFDSYTIPEDDLELGQLSLLEVDNRVVVPAKSHLRIIVTSNDVLYSWVIPSIIVQPVAIGENPPALPEPAALVPEPEEVVPEPKEVVPEPKEVVPELEEVDNLIEKSFALVPQILNVFVKYTPL
ncbi:cytochrome c oxidase subunit 2, partial [Tanacetum coccineum]